MQYESVAQALEALDRTQKTEAAYNHAMGVLYLDAATAAPKGSYVGRGNTMEVLSRLIYDLSTSPERGELLSYLESLALELDPVRQRQVDVVQNTVFVRQPFSQPSRNQLLSALALLLRAVPPEQQYSKHNQKR